MNWYPVSANYSLDSKDQPTGNARPKPPPRRPTHEDLAWSPAGNACALPAKARATAGPPLYTNTQHKNHYNPGGGRGWKFYLFQEMTHAPQQARPAKGVRRARLPHPPATLESQATPTGTARVPRYTPIPNTKQLQSWRGSGVEIQPFPLSKNSATPTGTARNSQQARPAKGPTPHNLSVWTCPYGRASSYGQAYTDVYWRIKLRRTASAPGETATPTATLVSQDQPIGTARHFYILHYSFCSFYFPIPGGGRKWKSNLFNFQQLWSCDLTDNPSLRPRFLNRRLSTLAHQSSKSGGNFGVAT
jgi:hypothetical protein